MRCTLRTLALAEPGLISPHNFTEAFSKAKPSLSDINHDFIDFTCRAPVSLAVRC
ncbi:hypothetical protein B0H17DRAFT_1074565 [Mycena rosella]|uniref:Uncharacterized protein n=1 Tax=Mycena rosella TaxID=1033263 RepID=A0AAD7GCT1_MYCRO|nr:hypothetical protein B0H17DRAFT_1074565 [Mycena rosella]